MQSRHSLKFPVSNQVFVAYRAGGSKLPPPMVFDGTAGNVLQRRFGQVNAAQGLNVDISIGCGDDGTLYGCPLNTGVTGTSAFKLYSDELEHGPLPVLFQ